MRRRTLLAGIATAATIPTVAGCLNDGGTDGDDGTDGPDGGAQSGIDSPDIETVSQRGIDDSSTDERNVESTATVTAAGEVIDIEGTLEAPTPCHEAVIGDVSIAGGTMTVEIELEESSDGDMCAQQISEIEYEATIEVAEGDPTRVVVVHIDRLREETAADVAL